jgi:uncharacterized membrane protein YdbT with pleckstrin-like domain
MVEKFESEEEIIKAHPSPKPAYGMIALGMLLLIPSFFLIFSAIANIFGWILYAIGIIIFFYGLAEFIKTRRTNYYATDKRIIKEYKTLYSLRSNEIPLSMVRAVTVKRDLMGTLFKVGDVLVSSGGDKIMNIDFKFIDNPDEIANRIRQLITV